MDITLQEVPKDNNLQDEYYLPVPKDNSLLDGYYLPVTKDNKHQNITFQYPRY